MAASAASSTRGDEPKERFETVFVGIGANMGDKARNCRQAVERVFRLPGCTRIGVSPLYRTEPVGVERQDWYVNGVMAVKVAIPARELLHHLLDIESSMGRIRMGKWDPRPVDLDILLFGRQVIGEKDLEIPHPRMHLRRFVLVPLAGMAPRLRHPVLGKTMAELLNDLPEDGQAVTLLGED